MIGEDSDEEMDEGRFEELKEELKKNAYVPLCISLAFVCARFWFFVFALCCLLPSGRSRKR